VQQVLIAAPTANFTRPSDTTAYSIGDLVANSTTAASVVALSWTPFKVRAGGWITGARLRIDKSDVTNAQFRLHLYSATPTFVTGGDNSAFSTVVATGYASWLCSFDATLYAIDAAGVAGIMVPTEGLVAPAAIGQGSTVYGILEARAAYTPKSASVLTVELLVEGN
jgi:hypothetical protein